MTTGDADERTLTAAMGLATGVPNSAAVARELRQMPGVSADLADLVHFLHHYVADEDLRARDAGYADWQLQRLRQLVAVASMERGSVNTAVAPPADS